MASGDTLLILGPLHAVAPSSAFATLDSRNGHQVLDYDDEDVEAAIFEAALPAHYDGGGITVTIVWAASTAESGDVLWSVAIERIAAGDLDIDADSFASAVGVAATAPGTSGQVVYTQIDLDDGSGIDGLLPGEAFRLRVTREADDPADDMVGDAELLRVIISES